MSSSKWFLLGGCLCSWVAIVRGDAGVVRYQSNPPPRHITVVVAHQDDWQLFMGDDVAHLARGPDSLTFIYLTAGDDGRDSAYWRTRERAALRSTRVAMATTRTDSATCRNAIVRQHSIRECALINTKSFFLRLPDGRRDGAGFERYSRQSLRKLRTKRAGSIESVDGSATYNGWEDLMATVTELIASSGEPTILTTDPSVTVNPHDHFDHRMAGLLVADARQGRKWNISYYVGYALATRAANRSSEQARQKIAIFRAYDDVMTRADRRWSAYAEHPGFYSQCMLRTYSRRAPVRRSR